MTKDETREECAAIADALLVEIMRLEELIARARWVVGVQTGQLVGAVASLYLTVNAIRKAGNE